LRKRNAMKTFILSSVILLSLAHAHAQHEVFIKSDAAIQGYDPVAYFKESKPVKGQAQLSYTWKQAKWHFTSQQNLEDFKRNPEKFAPQFGGYCAYGMAEGHKAPTSPDAWTILDDKLYLNYNKNVKELWDKDRPGNIEKANKNWPTVKNDKD
jgi:YHS domain-containing protein